MTLEAATNDRSLDEATAWRIALTEHGQVTTQEFERWLAADTTNREAWRQVQSSWDVVGRHAQSAGLDNMRRDALLRAGAARQDRETRRRRIGALAACLLLLICVTVTVQGIQWWNSQPAIYATALAERRVVTLDDESRLTLDSNSEVQVSYNRDARKLVLLRGQARFDVAKDPLRPFSVLAGDKLIVATGTAFTIDIADGKVVVTLIEGKVSVLKAGSVGNGLHLGSAAAGDVSVVQGQQAVASMGSTVVQIAPANLEKAVSWEQGLLMFEDETLSSVAQRVSRYSERKVTVDPSVADLKISGVFQAGDTKTFVDAVSSYLPVDAQSHGTNEVRLTRRS